MENLKMTNSIAENLLTATKWLKFLNIVAAVGVALVVIAGLFMAVSGAPQGLLLLVSYMIAAGIYAYPLIKSFSLVSNIREAINSDSQNALESAAENFKSLLKYMGVLTIVVLCLYVVILLCAVIFVGAL